MAGDRLLSTEDVRAIHDQVVLAYDLDHADVSRRNPDLFLERVVEEARQAESPFDRAAIYVCRLIDLHLFEDGNKRTAWLSGVRVLQQHGVTATPDREEVPTVLKHIRRYRVEEISTWLENGEIDRSKLRT